MPLPPCETRRAGPLALKVGSWRVDSKAMLAVLCSALVIPALVALLVAAPARLSAARDTRTVRGADAILGATDPPDRPTVSGGSPASTGSADAVQGLHYTADELATWRGRAAAGPFRSDGDAYTHSPGDWERIVANTEAFLAAPGDGRWSPEWGDGPIPTTRGRQTHVPSFRYTARVRDAAFYALVADDERAGQSVIAELLAQARDPNADVGDRARFPSGQGRVTDTNPYFMTASALTTLLFAADYAKQWASPTELAELRQWHRDAADWFFPDMRDRCETRFPGRDRGDYTPGKKPDDGRIGFLEGPPTTFYGRVHNNREGVIWLYIGLVGLDQDDPLFREQTKMWFREWVMFAVYPSAGSYGGRSWSGGGWFAEMERFEASGELGADGGWAYVTSVLNVVGMIADHFARAGDRSLYEFETRAGLYGTEAAPDQEPKSLLFALQEVTRHTNGEIRRYGTEESDLANDDYLIDGYNPESGWNGVNDVAFTVMNLYYQDPLLHQAYLRQGPGLRPHPRSPPSSGRGPTWQGFWGMYPGVLFQAGMLEGSVDPYGRQSTSIPGLPGALDATHTSSIVIERG